MHRSTVTLHLTRTAKDTFQLTGAETREAFFGLSVIPLHDPLAVLVLRSAHDRTRTGQEFSSLGTLWSQSCHPLTHSHSTAGRQVAVLVTGNTSVHCIMMCREGCNHHEHIVETIMPQFDSLRLHHCLMCWLVLPVPRDVHNDVLFHCGPKMMTFWW